MLGACLSIDVWIPSALNVVLSSSAGLQICFADSSFDAAYALRSEVRDGNSCVDQIRRLQRMMPSLSCPNCNLKEKLQGFFFMAGEMLENSTGSRAVLEGM